MRHLSASSLDYVFGVSGSFFFFSSLASRFEELLTSSARNIVVSNTMKCEDFDFENISLENSVTRHPSENNVFVEKQVDVNLKDTQKTPNLDQDRRM